MATNYNVPILKMDRIIRKLELAISNEASETVRAKLRNQLAYWQGEKRELIALVQASAKNAEELRKAKRIKNSTQVPLTFKTKGKTWHVLERRTRVYWAGSHHQKLSAIRCRQPELS